MFTFHYKEFTIIVKEVKVWIKSKLENLLPSVEKKKMCEKYKNKYILIKDKYEFDLDI